MHILLIIEGTYPWYRGGVSEWVYQYLSCLNGCEFSILQIATDEFQGLDPTKALYPIPENVVKFERISPPKIEGQWETYLEDWYQQYKELCMAMSSYPDIIHVTNTGFAGWLGSRISEAVTKPMVLTEHAIYWKEIEMGAVALECGYKIPESAQRKEEVKVSFKEIAKFTYSHAEQIVTVSESNTPYQEKLGANNIKYIPNGVPEDWVIEDKERMKNPVIGWVGRCAEMKNPLAFFDYIKSLNETDLRPHFIILLSSANEEGLEKRVRKKAEEFTDLTIIWNESSKDYFKDMDFLVITSHNESQPLVMLEAIANRALPVGKSVGDLSETYGLVFEADRSYEYIAKEIEQIWSSPRNYEEKLNSCFSVLKEKHIWSGIFDSYHTLFEEIIQRDNA